MNNLHNKEEAIATRQQPKKDPLNGFNPTSVVKSDCDWWDYDAHKAVKVAPVGEVVIFDCFGKGWKEAVIISAHGDWLWCDTGLGGLITTRMSLVKPLDHATRKAEQERKKVVSAVISAWSEIPDMADFKECFSKLYDAGFLKLPEPTK